MRKKELPYESASGFQVPENYFRDLGPRIMHEVSSPGKPVLSTREMPFSTPEHYFGSFPSRVFDRLKQEKHTGVRRIARRKRMTYLAAMAAVIVVVFLSVVFRPVNLTRHQEIEMIAIENYLLETLEYYGPEAMPHLQEGQQRNSGDASILLDREVVLEYLQENVEDVTVLLNP